MEGSWLCPTELDRMRVVDANARVRTIRHIGAASIGIALLIAAPWVGWWTLLPFAAAAFNLWHIDRRIARSPRPERVSALGILVTVAMLALARIFMLEQRGPVETKQAMRVAREMRGHPIQDHADPGLMARVHEESKIVGRAEARSGREISGDLITPGTVKRMLGDGE